MSDTALVKTSPQQSGIITTAQAFKGSLENWRQHHFHVLTPAAAFTALPPQWGLLPVKVEINPHEEGGEVYRDPLFCKQDEVCLTKNGLRKLQQALGASIATERTDPRTIANYWEVQATARYMGLDGTPQQHQATEELDLRDGTERSRKVLGQKNAVGALVAKRAKGHRNCEALAINAVIREFGIKQKYSLKELERPFMVVRMLFLPDMSNPTQAAIATQQALGGVSMLFPSTPLASLPPAHGDVIDGTTVQTSSAQPARQIETTPKASKVDTVDVDLESGTHSIVLESGVVALTEHLEVAKAAQRAKKNGQGVVIATEQRGNEVFITELQIANAGSTQAATTKTAGAPSAMPDGTTTIADIKKVDSPKDAKRPWKRYDVTFANGEVASTFSQTLHQLIDEANQQKARVRITTSEREGYNDNLDSLEIIDKRQQSLPDPGDL